MGATGPQGATGADGAFAGMGYTGATGPQGATGATDLSLALKLDQTTPQTVANGAPVINEGIQLGLTPTHPSNSIGRVYWDSSDATLAVDLTSDVTLQIGQEQYVRVVNKTGSIITDGSVVRISGAQGNRPTAVLAQANTFNSSVVIGIATHNIGINEEGFITTHGVVRGFDTSVFSAAGAYLYLDPANAGKLVDQITTPVPEYVVPVAVALNKTNNGSIFVSPFYPRSTDGTLTGNSNSYSPSEKAIKTYVDTNIATRKPYHGIEALGALSFNTSSHVLSIASGTNTYWYHGVKYTTASAITCDIDTDNSIAPNTLYYFYFADATGTLKCTSTPFGILTDVPVATVFWNGTAGAIQYEKHNHTRDLDWHMWAHDTVGCRYESGFSLVAPTTSADGTLNIGTGIIHDEDQDYSTGQMTTMRGWYLADATHSTFADYALPYLGTLGAPVFLNTSSYTLSTFSASNYVCYWVYASLDKDRPCYITPTHATAAFNTLSAARANTAPVTVGMNSEMKLIYKFIYSGNGQFQEMVDYRSSSPVPSGGIPTISAGGVSFLPYGNIASTSVQAAIEELDTEKQPLLVSGTNIKTINSTSILGSGNIVTTGGHVIKEEGVALTQRDNLALVGAGITASDVSGETQVEVDWNITSGGILANKTVTIPAGQSSVVVGAFSVAGTLNLNGTMVVL
jgi:hypothetical protein